MPHSSFPKADVTFAKIDGMQLREPQFGMGLHSPPSFLFKFGPDGATILAKAEMKSVEIGSI